MPSTRPDIANAQLPWARGQAGYVGRTITSFTVVKVFIWKSKDNISSHVTEDKEVKDKKRLISSFTISGKESIDKRGRDRQRRAKSKRP